MKSTYKILGSNLSPPDEQSNREISRRIVFYSVIKYRRLRSSKAYHNISLCLCCCWKLTIPNRVFVF